MSQFVATPTRAFSASGAIPMFSRVKFAAGQISVAGAADMSIGIVERPAFNAGDMVSVRLRKATGTKKMIASGAITQGVNVYAAASGQIGTTNTNPLEGIALEAAVNAGDIIEVLQRG